MTFQSWKSWPVIAEAVTAHLLQCGHDVSVMEMPTDSRLACVRSPLQCGHDVSVMEMPDPLVGDWQFLVLQCGHDVSVMEIWRYVRSRLIQRTKLQCGHDVSVMEMSLR